MNKCWRIYRIWSDWTHTYIALLKDDKLVVHACTYWMSITGIKLDYIMQRVEMPRDEKSKIENDESFFHSITKILDDIKSNEIPK